VTNRPVVKYVSGIVGQCGYDGCCNDYLQAPARVMTSENECFNACYFNSKIKINLID
jgi:hypothetical protein